jgi:hypothetical protein
MEAKGREKQLRPDNKEDWIKSRRSRNREIKSSFSISMFW